MLGIIENKPSFFSYKVKIKQKKEERENYRKNLNMSEYKFHEQCAKKKVKSFLRR